MTYASRLFAFGRARANQSVLTKLRAANALYRQRAALKRLTDRELQDIGLSRDAVSAETTKPLWSAPVHWRA